MHNKKIGKWIAYACNWLQDLQMINILLDNQSNHSTMDLYTYHSNLQQWRNYMYNCHSWCWFNWSSVNVTQSIVGNSILHFILCTHVHMRRLIKPGSQYDSGAASIASIMSIMRKRFLPSQILFLMSNSWQSDWLYAS